jgi:hypothetical protein
MSVTAAATGVRLNQASDRNGLKSVRLPLPVTAAMWEHRCAQWSRFALAKLIMLQKEKNMKPVRSLAEVQAKAATGITGSPGKK